MNRVCCFLLFCFLFFGRVSFAQTSLNDYSGVISKLKSELLISKSDSLKCVLHFKLSDYYYKWEVFDKYKFHLQSANSLIKNNPFLKDLSIFYNATFYYLNKDQKTYYQRLRKAVELLKKYDVKEVYVLRARIYNNLAIYYQLNSDDDEILRQIFDEAIPLAEKGGSKEWVGILYGTVARLMFNYQNYEQSEKYYKYSIKVLEGCKPFQVDYLVESYLTYSQLLIKLKKSELGIIYLDKAEAVIKNNPLSTLSPRLYYYKGYYYFRVNNFNKAIYFLDIAKKRADALHDKLAVLDIKLLKSNCFIALKKYKPAQKLLIEYLESPEILPSDKMSFSKNLAWVSIKINDSVTAIKYFEQYITLSDSLNEAHSKNKMSALEAKFNASQKEKKILQLQQEKSVKENDLKTLKMWYLFAVLALIILLIMIYSFYKNLRNQKMINYQKDLIHQKDLDNLNSQKEIELMQAMIDGEETERKRIARDLHDGIGSRLSSLKMQLGQVENFNHDKFSTDLGFAISDLRQIAFNLVPETLSKLGLDNALKDLCFTVSNANVTIQYNSSGIDTNIVPSNQITIFRIVQELINNSLKHSNCTDIFVDCSQNGTLFLITVEDNGIGFNSTDLDYFSGLGLKNIKNRVELLRGKIEVRSSSFQGTIFNIELTVQEQNEEEV